MPDDYRLLYESTPNEKDKYRIVCDFIAGMTDAYCIEFYARLTSEDPETIFKPF
jgi:dGTPase